MMHSWTRGPIVVATDFSEVAREGVQWACFLERSVRTSPDAEGSDSPAQLLHVLLGRESAALYPLDELFEDGTELEQRLAMHAEVALDRLVVEAAQFFEHTPVDPFLRTARSVAAGIVEFAEEKRARLLVLGTHGRGGFKRWLLGSVTEEVVRLAGCPVLCCPPRPETERRDEVHVRQILAAVDLSEASVAVVDHGRDLAHSLSASLEVAHVIDESRDGATSVSEDLERRARTPLSRERARDELVDLGNRRGLARVAARYRVGTGRAPDVLLEVARKTGSGMIVIAARSAQNEARRLGGVVHELLRNACCPVLVVPPSSTTVDSALRGTA